MSVHECTCVFVRVDVVRSGAASSGRASPVDGKSGKRGKAASDILTDLLKKRYICLVRALS